MSHRPRIALTTRIPVSEAGGIEASVRELAPRIAALRPAWDVRVINAFAKVATWNRVPFFGDLIAALVLAAKTAPFDVVVINGGEYAWPRTFRSLDRKRTVVVWHGTRVGEIPALAPRMSPFVRVYFALEKWLQRFALSVSSQIAVSITTKRELEAAYKTRATIHIIPNGAPKLKPIPRNREATRRVAWIGTNAYKKGLDIALAACESARHAFDDLELLVIGIAPPQGVSRTGVRYVGRIGHDESIEVLRAVDVMLATSRYEGCSIAILEGMALGIPIVAGPSVAWMVGEAGLAVDDFDGESYARALIDVFSAPSRLNAMSAAGPERVRHFDWDAAADAYVSEVERCLAS
jgi:glycosyltransferase involved in cell wall biosynthesis